jgi:hypothetical protein
VDRSTFNTIAESLLASGFSVRFRAGGRSMAPAVRDGERLTVEPVDARDVAVGDVVLCQTWRGPLAHRVMRVERDARGELAFVLRGDASLEDDRPVAAAQLRGRVVRVEGDGAARALGIAGGVIGRRLFVMALHARPRLAAAARALIAGVSVLARGT